MKDTPSKPRKPRTNAVHAGIRRSQFGEVSEAMFLTQGFVYPTAEDAEERFLNSSRENFIYARYGNPTVAMFEDRIAALEGTEDAFACASGMAAVNGTMMSILKAGDHVVAARALFGSCLYILEEILPRFGVEVTLIDGTDLEAWKAALRPDTRVAFFETISNPTLEVIDIAGVADLAHAVGAVVVVDNVFATPTYSRALELGADVIVYSTTKHIDGQGRCLGGVICGKQEFVRGTAEPYLKHTGGSMSPFNAWVMLKGLEHLDLRVRAQTDTATKVAAALDGHPKLVRVLYPHDRSHPQYDLAIRQMEAGGTVLSFDIKGGKDAAYRFLNALEIIIISNNLGDAKTIATPPYTTTHQRLPEDRKAALGITPGLIRLSCGLEDTGDLIDDILNALDAA
ncbi:O-succinylhomoserine sulfhydrylase [Jannaschia faecimaris]|uniref:O-succinylhomoserine sulfhydrylase n=1 Tax=Jannaschia faecimaris TaxID=1244108 RepID=A0A1H3QC97_9RHOB|nr:O-succinylhomoserine sulfhydrylase [Jannaschia faecimaris]SDZ10349.1 O-succinylhomoserine sulfhydrylase [Jannaschia faecimaris]